jgi:hypothetical protein
MLHLNRYHRYSEYLPSAEAKTNQTATGTNDELLHFEISSPNYILTTTQSLRLYKSASSSSGRGMAEASASSFWY